MLHTKETLNTYLSAFCDQPIDKIRSDTDRDFYMTPQEAKAYGIIDEVIMHKRVLATPKIPSLKVAPPLSVYDLGNIVNSKPRESIENQRSYNPYDTGKKLWS